MNTNRHELETVDPKLIFKGAHPDTAIVGTARSAGFQTCCIADFQIGRPLAISPSAGLETRDTADLEVCATVAVSGCALFKDEVYRLEGRAIEVIPNSRPLVSIRG